MRVIGLLQLAVPALSITAHHSDVIVQGFGNADGNNNRLKEKLLRRLGSRLPQVRLQPFETGVDRVDGIHLRCR